MTDDERSPDGHPERPHLLEHTLALLATINELANELKVCVRVLESGRTVVLDQTSPALEILDNLRAALFSDAISHAELARQLAPELEEEIKTRTLGVYIGALKAGRYSWWLNRPQARAVLASLLSVEISEGGFFDVLKERVAAWPHSRAELARQLNERLEEPVNVNALANYISHITKGSKTWWKRNDEARLLLMNILETAPETNEE